MRSATRDRAAFAYALAGALASSAAPLVVSLFGALSRPLLFNAIWKTGGAIGLLAMLLIRYRHVIGQREFRARIATLAGPAVTVAIVAGECDMLIFTVALRYVDVSVAAVLYQTWPALLIIMMLAVFRVTPRYSRGGPGIALPVALALAGVVLVTASGEHGGTGPPSGAGQMLGALLAVGSAVAVGAEIAATIRVSAGATDGARPRTADGRGTKMPSCA